MESKIINLSKKLYRSNRGLSPNDFYHTIRVNPHYQIIFDNLKPSEIAILCLIVGNMRDDSDVESLYNQIKGNIFVFSLVEITDDVSYHTCSYCGADGEVNCDNCNGNSEVDCPDCDGSGEREGGGSCSNCRGDGKVDCIECSRGYITCEKCEGTGEEVDDNSKQITQEFYVSYDSNLFNYLEMKLDDMDEISQENYSKIIKSRKTIKTFSEDGSSSDFDDYSSGDIIFVGLNKEEIDFLIQRGNFLNPMSIISYL